MFKAKSLLIIELASESPQDSQEPVLGFLVRGITSSDEQYVRYHHHAVVSKSLDCVVFF